MRRASFVKLPKFVRITVFRWISSAFTACIPLFSAIVYREKRLIRRHGWMAPSPTLSSVHQRPPAFKFFFIGVPARE
jgi:hypothetical protein